MSGQGAIVIFALDNGKPIHDTMKITSLKRHLYEQLKEGGIVTIKTVRWHFFYGTFWASIADDISTASQVTGLPHHERLLHKLLLQVAERDWNEYQKVEGTKVSTEPSATGVLRQSFESGYQEVRHIWE